MSDELDGMARLAEGVAKQEWPHCTDAQVWADKWLETITQHADIPVDRAAMLGWFANAIMAGYDTAMMQREKRALMIWTSQPPTVPGWYWWRADGYDARIVHVLEGCVLCDVGHKVCHVVIMCNYDGHWAGPLARPEEG